MALGKIDGGAEVIFGQRDYGGTRLGLCDGIDRGLYGCYTTSVAMVLRHYGYDTDPGRLDELLTMGPSGDPNDPGTWQPIYVDGCAMVDNAAEIVTGGAIQLTDIADWTGQTADLSFFSMAADEEIVVGIDGSAYFGYPTHFLRVFSWDGSTMICCDPWNKERLDVEATFGAPFGWDLSRLVIKGVKHKLPGWVPPWSQQPAPAPTPSQPVLVSSTPAAGTVVTVLFQGHVFAPDAMFYDAPGGNAMGQNAPIGDFSFWQGAYDGTTWWDRMSTDGGPEGDWWVLDSKVDTGNRTPADFYNAIQPPLQTRMPAAPYPMAGKMPPSIRAKLPPALLKKLTPAAVGRR